MKYSLMLFFIILMIVNCYAQEETRRKHLTYYEQRKSLFELLPNDKDEIIFVGNSITDGCEWSELFRDKRIKNRGISADVAEGVLIRLDEVIESKPLKVFLMIGINDLAFGYSIAEILQNYDSIISKIKNDSKATKVYIQSVLPINESFSKFKSYMKLSAKIVLLNKELQKLATDNDIVYINLYDLFLLNNRLNPEYTNDGLHLTGKGYLFWKEHIEKYINE